MSDDTKKEKNKVIPKTTKLSYEDLEKAIGVNLADKWREQRNRYNGDMRCIISVLPIIYYYEESTYEEYDEKDKQIPKAQMEWWIKQPWFYERQKEIQDATGLPDMIIIYILLPYSAEIWQECIEKEFKINENRSFTRNIINEFQIISMEKFTKAKHEEIEKNKKLVIGQLLQTSTHYLSGWNFCWTFLELVKYANKIDLLTCRLLNK